MEPHILDHNRRIRPCAFLGFLDTTIKLHLHAIVNEKLAFSWNSNPRLSNQLTHCLFKLVCVHEFLFYISVHFNLCASVLPEPTLAFTVWQNSNFKARSTSLSKFNTCTQFIKGCMRFMKGLDPALSFL